MKKWVMLVLIMDIQVALVCNAGVLKLRKLLKKPHVTLGSGDMQAIMARINKESGGHQNIKQQIYDINTANGNPAQGLLQYIPPTF